TDHGGIPAGHGGGTLEERNAFTGWFQSGIEAEELEREVLPDASSVSYVQLPAGTYAQPDNQDMFNFGETQDFTIECWVRAVTGYTEDPVLLSNKDWNSGYNPGFVLSATNGQYWKVNLGDGTDRVDIHGGVLGPDWTHIAVSVDRDGIMSAYENGAIVGKEDVTAIGNLHSGLPLVINQDGTLAYGFEAEFDFADIRIWKAALDHQTILDHALNDPDASHPYWTDLLAHWRCDETEGSTLSDNGPLGQPAMIVGSPSWLQASGERVLFDYANAASQEDNAVTALHWLCVPVDPDWHLDGNSLLPACESNGLSAADYPAFLPYPVPARHRIYVPWSAGTVATWYKQDGSIAGTGNVGTGGGMDIPPLSPGIYSLVSEKGMFRIAVE
ncbi:MAG: DUF4983 domain-containing protein, partial [Flavobacteriales bacterium]|nr:DUF4983 domain-containing protein [Flavobacteriales bacterium]